MRDVISLSLHRDTPRTSTSRLTITRLTIMSSRRSTLRSLLLGSLALVTAPVVYVTARFARPLPSAPATIELGTVESIPTDDWHFVRVGERAAMVRRSGPDIVAIDLRCPHAGCSVEWRREEKEFICPCHGARFDQQGKVTAGPAREDLHRMTTSISNGVVTITSRA